MTKVCMTTTNFFDRFDEVVDEVGVSDQWDDELAVFEQMTLEGLQGMDGIEQVLYMVGADEQPSLVACLRTVEPLAPWGETGRCGLWYLFRTQTLSHHRLIVIGKGDYDHSSHLFSVKRLTDTNDGKRLNEYFEFLLECIQHCRERIDV